MDAPGGALRHRARGLNPAGAYLAEGEPEGAALAIAEKALIDGARPATLSAPRALYARIPDGGCAVNEAAGALRLNLECPRLGSDLCAAWLDLAQAFNQARQPAASNEFARRAQDFHCH